MLIESIIESGEHVVNRFSGSSKGKNGTWFVTNRRLIHLPSPEVKTDLKKAIVGGALFGGIGATRGLRVEMSKSFDDYRLDNLVSIDFETIWGAGGKQRKVLKAIFQAPRSGDKETIYIIDVKNLHDFKSEVIKAKNKLEEERTQIERAEIRMMKDEKIQELSSEIEVLEKELKELESEAKDLDIGYAVGRISQETYLEKMKERELDEKMNLKKSILETKKKEVAQRKEKYVNSRCPPESNEKQ